MGLTLVYDDQSSYAWTPKMGEEEIVIRVSKSTLTASKWCPQQLWLSKTHEVPQVQHDYLVIGDDVHQSMEAFYHNIELDSITSLKKAAEEGKGKDTAENHDSHGDFLFFVVLFDKFFIFINVINEHSFFLFKVPQIEADSSNGYEKNLNENDADPS